MPSVKSVKQIEIEIGAINYSVNQSIISISVRNLHLGIISLRLHSDKIDVNSVSSLVHWDQLFFQK
jgi:hypothetical protein